jgi:hypothetical protein
MFLFKNIENSFDAVDSHSPKKWLIQHKTGIVENPPPFIGSIRVSGPPCKKGLKAERNGVEWYNIRSTGEKVRLLPGKGERYANQ